MVKVAAVAVLAALVLASGASAGVIAVGGVQVTVPGGWISVKPAPDPSIQQASPLLVVGTTGAAPRKPRCPVAAYTVPPRGAVVVILRWSKSEGSKDTGRGPLTKLVGVKPAPFQCFAGRGAYAAVALGGRLYQVNVMVGDKASSAQIAQALAVARSFDLTH